MRVVLAYIGEEGPVKYPVELSVLALAKLIRVADELAETDDADLEENDGFGRD